MKILHVSKFYPPYRGGIEDVCYGIVQELHKYHEQMVICFNDGKNNLDSCVEGVRVWRVGCSCSYASQPLSFSLYGMLKQAFQSFSPDAVHLHLPNPLACLYVLHLIPSHTQLILHWHSDIVAQKLFYKFFVGCERRILKRADKIIVTSQAYLDASLPLACFKEKTIVIPNVISLEKMELREDDESKVKELKEIYRKPIVFFMGRHVPYKGIEYLIEAEKYISNDCVILIAGSGPLTKALKMKSSSSRIKFIGRIPDEEIRIYMNAAIIFAFPSVTKNEAFGVVLAEAMYCGAVPVTFTIEGSGVNWVSLDGVTGLEVSNSDAVALGQSIDTLLTDKSLYGKFSQNARDRVLSNFTMDAIRNTLLKLYPVQ